MTLSFEGTYNKDEVFAMAKLSRHPVAKAREGDPQAGQGTTTVRAYVIFAFASCMVGLFTFLLGDFRAMSFLFGFVVALGLMMFWLEVLGPHQAWKSLSAHPVVFKGTATDEAVEIQWTSQSIASQYQWDAFKGYGEHENIIVLFMQHGNYIGLPKSYFRNDKEWEAFRKTVAEKLAVTHRVIVPTTRETMWKIAKVIALIAGVAAVTYFWLRP